jgi:hypothetical protein
VNHLEGMKNHKISRKKRIQMEGLRDFQMKKYALKRTISQKN